MRLFQCLHVNIYEKSFDKGNLYCWSVKKLLCFQDKVLLLRTKQHWANFARYQSLQQRHFTKLAQFSMLCYVCLHSKLFRLQKRNWLISSLHIINFFQFIKTGWSVSHFILWTTANVYSPCFKFPICVLDFEQFPFTA